MNLHVGDSLEVLKKINEESVDLIYLDPPFFTQTKQKLKNKENKEFSFEDSWNDIKHYKEYIKDRLIQCHRVLKKTGSIFLHCDKAASHHLRVILDEVFKAQNFQSEIIWTYKRWSNSKKGLLNSHQNIYFYSKSKNFKFNMQYTDYSPTTNIDQILQKRVRDTNGKTSYMKNENNEDVICAKKKGVPLSDVWDIPYLNPKANERVGYPTQKPLLLLERIIELVTDEKDVVLDPFCGSGTTLVAASLLNRNYIGIDISKEAIELTKSRLENPIKTVSNLLVKGKDAYKSKSDYELSLLNMLEATPVQRNSGIDGFLKKDFNGSPVCVKIQKDTETVDEAKHKLFNASKSKKCSLLILIKTNENGDTKKDYDNLIVIEEYRLLIQKLLKDI